jgi:hypothetical protein
MAVDGVALKNAVDAWAAAPEQERVAGFAAAEAVRWLEWGANSFFQIVLGLTLGLLGAAVSRTLVVGHWLGWVAAAAGACLIGGGVISGTNASPVKNANAGPRDASANRSGSSPPTTVAPTTASTGSPSTATRPRVISKSGVWTTTYGTIRRRPETVLCDTTAPPRRRTLPLTELPGSSAATCRPRRVRRVA